VERRREGETVNVVGCCQLVQTYFHQLEVQSFMYNDTDIFVCFGVSVFVCG